jgi:Transglycosylase-like domain
MRKRIAAAMLGVALLGAPAAANGENNKPAGHERVINAALKNGEHTSFEKRYLRLYKQYADEFGVQSAGRNIVVFGAKTDRGIHDAGRDRVVSSADYFEAQLNPPEVAVETTESTATTTYSAGATASSSTAQCESGGDYGAVNPAGYYGAYQFDQSTWDAYAPEGYAGSNPATAPPAVQDQAAASVPYDAWPNC